MAERRADPGKVLVCGDLGPSSRVVQAAAALSGASALTHLWKKPELFIEWWGYGVFFLATAVAQGLFGVLLLRLLRPSLALAGLLDNLAAVLLYVLSRTRGVPVGPHAGEVEPTEFPDVAATAVELA